MNLRNVILALLMGLIVGTACGFYTKAQFFEAEQKDEVAEVRKTDAASITQAAQKDQALGQRQDTKTAAVEEIKKEFRNEKSPGKRLSHGTPANRNQQARSQKPIAQGLEPADVQDFVDPFDLSIADVRLLNSAREGAFDRSALPSDAEKQTPSSVTREEFIENDLDIVAEYHRLAEAHDELVDAVAEMQAKQRKRLGLPD